MVDRYGHLSLSDCQRVLTVNFYSSKQIQLLSLDGLPLASSMHRGCLKTSVNSN